MTHTSRRRSIPKKLGIPPTNRNFSSPDEYFNHILDRIGLDAQRKYLIDYVESHGLIAIHRNKDSTRFKDLRADKPSKGDGISVYLDKSVDKYLIKIFNEARYAHIQNGDMLTVHMKSKGFSKKIDAAKDLLGDDKELAFKPNRAERRRLEKQREVQKKKNAQKWIPNHDHTKTKTRRKYKTLSWDGIKYYKEHIDVNTLERFDVYPIEKAYGHSFTHEDPIFAYITHKDQVKAKRPLCKEKKREFWLRYSGNYLFGLNQLVKDHKERGKCEAIILSAGENDCMTINQGCNEHGIYSVTLSSEATPKEHVLKQLIDLLLTYTDQLFVVYDDDEQGNKASKDISQISNRIATELKDDRYIIRTIKFPHKFRENDVCDVVKQIGYKETIEELVKTVKYANTVSGYASDIIDRIKATQKTTFTAKTGTGKTYAFINIIVPLLQREYPDKIIRLAAPFNLLTQSIAREYNIPFYTGEASKEEKLLAKNSQFCITNYDGIKRSLRDGSKLEDTIIIVDEFHELSEGSAYRKACNLLAQYCNHAFRSVFISATPLEDFERFGYKPCNIPVRQGYQVNLNVYKREKGCDAAHAIASVIMKDVDPVDEKVCFVYLRDIQKAKNIEKLLKRRKWLKEGKKVTYLNKEETEPDSDLAYLKEHQRIRDGIKIVFCTNIIGSGANIYNKNIGKVIYCPDANGFDIPNEREAIQFSARFRHMKTVDMIMIIKEKKGIQRNDESFEDIMELASKCCEDTNLAYNGLKALFSGTQAKEVLKENIHTSNIPDGFMKYVLFDEEEDKYKTDEAAVVFHSDMLRRRKLSTNAFVNILRKEDNFNVTMCEETINVKDEELTSINQEVNAIRREAESRLIDMLFGEEIADDDILEACRIRTKDQGIQQSIHKAFPELANRDTATAFKLLEEEKEVFKNAKFSLIHYYCKLIKHGFNKEEAIKIFDYLSKNKDNWYFSNTKFYDFFNEFKLVEDVEIYSKHRELLTDATRINQARIIKKFNDKIRKHNIGKWKSEKWLKDLLISIIKSDCSEEEIKMERNSFYSKMSKEALNYFKIFFDFEKQNEEQRDGTKITIYRIDGKKSAAEILGKTGILRRTFFERKYLGANKLTPKKE